MLDGEFNVVVNYEYDAWGNIIRIKDNIKKLNSKDLAFVIYDVSINL